MEWKSKKTVKMKFYTCVLPLLFRSVLAYLAQDRKKTKEMCNIAKAYSRFGEMVADGSVCNGKDRSFASVCRRLGVSPSSMNEILEEELGMSGEMILYKCEKLLNL